MLPEAISVLMFVVNILERLHIPHLIGGSMVSAVYGVTRSTLDADIVADLHLDKISTCINALGGDFYAEEAMIQATICL